VGVTSQAFEKMRGSWYRFGLLFVTAAFWLFFAWQAKGFLSSFNVFTLLRFASVQVMVGFAQMIALSAGEMDISVGAIGGGVAMFVGALMQLLGVPFPLAILLGVLLGATAGFTNGMLVIKTKINSFIITLATSSMFSGIMFITTRAKAFTVLPKGFVDLSGVWTFGLPVSPLVWIMLAVAVLLYFMYSATSLGRKILAVGANRRAAEMSGLRSSKIRVIVFVLVGAVAGLAGIMEAAMMESAGPIIGTEWLITSFAVPAIGGTSIFGGNVVVFGAVLGGILTSTITNGVLLMNVSNFFVNFFLGLILLLAVGFDQLQKVYRERTSVR